MHRAKQPQTETLAPRKAATNQKVAVPPPNTNRRIASVARMQIIEKVNKVNSSSSNSPAVENAADSLRASALKDLNSLPNKGWVEDSPKSKEASDAHFYKLQQKLKKSGSGLR